MFSIPNNVGPLLKSDADIKDDNDVTAAVDKSIPVGVRLRPSYSDSNSDSKRKYKFKVNVSEATAAANRRIITLKNLANLYSTTFGLYKDGEITNNHFAEKIANRAAYDQMYYNRINLFLGLVKDFSEEVNKTKIPKQAGITDYQFKLRVMNIRLPIINAYQEFPLK